MRVVPAPLPLAQRHRHVRGPQRAALRRAQPARSECGIEQHLHPAGHVAQAATDAAGRHRGQIGAALTVGALHHVASVLPRVRLGDVADRRDRPRADLAAIHPQRREHFLAQQLIVRLATGGSGDLARDHIHQVVVGVAAAEAGDRPEMGQAGDDVLPGETVGLGPQHQVARPQAEAAVVDQQVTHLHLLRHPRVMHAELRHVLDDRVIPAQCTALDQAREQRGGHRLAVGGDLEEGVRVDGVAAAGDPLAGSAFVHDAPILHHGHGQARQRGAHPGLVEHPVERRRRRRRSGAGRHPEPCQHRRPRPLFPGAHAINSSRSP